MQIKRWVRCACLPVLVGLCSVQALAQTHVQTVFPTAEAAVAALASAAEKNDVPALLALFGPGAEDILSSGDDVADQALRREFAARYQAKHSLVPGDNGAMILQVGDNDWPLPVPVVKKADGWVLDGAAGAEEIVNRRIGRNELGAIAVCHGFLEAQREYAGEGRDGQKPGIYASKLFSTPGKHDGLYWPAADGEPPSPAGERVAAATAEGYRAAAPGARNPYHGYYFRMLYAQGANASGGAADYFDNGLLTQGVALLAWPAEYGVSGIQTFMVNHDGIVYQKDLGESTAELVQSIDRFDPDASWSPVAEQD